MLQRLVGIETEYAIRFAPSRGGTRPGHETVFEALSHGLSRLVPTRPGERHGENGQVFLANGGAVYYEALPYAINDGLIEASTPECRGPSQLLLYQQAQQALLLRALPLAERFLAVRGYPGTLRLLKNCRDAEGHAYGAQENYEVTLNEGIGLVAYRLGVAALLPLVALVAILNWLFIPVLIAIMLSFYAIAGGVFLILPPLRRFLRRVFDFEGPRASATRFLGYLLYYTQYVVSAPVLLPYSALAHCFAFRRVRRLITSFIVSRPLITGAGTLMSDERFALSEKGPGINGIMRWGPSPKSHVIFDTGNLLKDLFAPAALRFAGMTRLFRKRQRLQLGLSDANLAQVAEYLKIGTTTLVLDMIEAGWLESAPILHDPLQALHTVIFDPTGKTPLPLKGGGSQSALELQRFFLDEARRFVNRSQTPSMEARDILRLWAEALEALETSPQRLVGRLDWVTKRYLLETAGAAQTYEARKKIDLRYHELGQGYFSQLEGDGLAATLVTGDEIENAQHTPPPESPAALRGRLIQELAASRADAFISWDSVRIGGRLRGKVIPLHKSPPSNRPRR